MAQNYIQPGKVIEVKATEGTRSGQAIKIGKRVGVALSDIPSGLVGSVQLCGVFELQKEVGVGMAFGADVYLDTNGLITTTESAAPAGMVVQDAATDAATVRVLLNWLPA